MFSDPVGNYRTIDVAITALNHLLHDESSFFFWSRVINSAIYTRSSDCHQAIVVLSLICWSVCCPPMDIGTNESIHDFTF